jgi:predicted small metal-binding protein
MMMKLACKDLGLNCDYVARGESKSEVLQAAMKHAITEHADITKNFTMDQSFEFLIDLDCLVQPESALITEKPNLVLAVSRRKN